MYMSVVNASAVSVNFIWMGRNHILEMKAPRIITFCPVLILCTALVVGCPSVSQHK